MAYSTFQRSRKRSSIARKYVFGLSVFIFLFAVTAALSFYYVRRRTEINEASAARIPQDFSIQLGREEFVMGPANGKLDTAFITYPVEGGWRSFVAQGETESAFTNDFNRFGQFEGIALDRGVRNSGVHDECGSWLLSVDRIAPDRWIGWYHSEDSCNYVAGYTHKKIAYAESYDQGKTWVKPDYPSNVVLTADEQYQGDRGTDDAGDGRVIRKDGYYYLFYLATGPNWRIHVARAPIISNGKPGTWLKYYCSAPASCDFTEPGIGGKSTPVNGLSGGSVFVSYNTYLDKYIMPFAGGKWGFQLAYAQPDDVINWSRVNIVPPVSFANDPKVDGSGLNRGDKRQWYNYASAISTEGDSTTTGRVFYLYYIKNFPGEGTEARYLVRRQVTLEKNPAGGPQNMIALARYERPDGKTITSTEFPNPKLGYQVRKVLGYIHGQEVPGSKPLSTCYIKIWDSYITIEQRNVDKSWEYCNNNPEVPFYKNEGWVSHRPSGTATVPLYRCFNSSLRNHFLTTEENCEGKSTEHRVLFGYISPGIK
ncbi:MAG TPA: hypothetical protein VF209_04745 [Patescibacteria group bacterium]